MRKFAAISISILIPSFLIAQCVSGTSWISDVGANWNVNGNWSPATFPNATDATAIFTSAHTGSPITLNQAITIGNLCLNSGGVTIRSTAGSQTLTFSSSSTSLLSVGPTGSFTIDSSPANGSDLILASPLVFSSQGGTFSYIGNLAGSQSLTVDQGTFNYSLLIFSAHPEYTGEVIIGPSGIFNATLLSGFTGLDFVLGNVSGSGQLNITDASQLLIGTADADATFTGPISVGAVGALGKTGTGTLTLTGPITTASMGQVAALGGTLVLTGSNSIEQISIGQPGVLSVSSLNNLGNPTLYLFSGGTLQVTGSTPFTISQAFTLNSLDCIFDIASTTALTISGVIGPGSPSGGLIKTGAGDLILTNTNTYTTTSTVNAGSLTVTGSIAGPAAVNGGTLRGTGTVKNVTVYGGGTIRPGITSIGTLTVNGALNLAGTAQIEISPSSNAQIHVTGLTSLLGGAVSVIQDAGTYPSSGSYPIIVSDGGILGFLSPTVTGGSPGFSFSLDYSTPNTLTLVYQLSSVPIPTSNLTGTADKFARYLNQYVPTSTATQALFAVPADQLQAALDSANPSRNAFAPFAVQNTMISVSDLVSNHLVDQRFYHAQKRYNPNVAALIDDASSFTADASGRMLYSRTCDSQSFWVGVMGEYAHQSELDENPAFNFWSGGSLIGWDFYGNQNLFGLSGGAAYTHLIQDENGGNAKIEYYFASIYDTFYGPCDFPLYAELALWGVYNQIHNYRNISFPGFEGVASATFHSWELVPHLGFGYNASYCCFNVEPFAQFDLVVDWQEGFKEHGVGAFDMTHTSRNSQFLRSEGGLRFYKTKQTSWGVWMGMVRGSFINKKAFGTGSIAAAIVGTSALFNVETFRNTQNLGGLGLEMLWRWGQRSPVTFSLAYNGEFGSQFWSQEAMIRLVKDF